MLFRCTLKVVEVRLGAPLTITWLAESYVDVPLR